MTRRQFRNIVQETILHPINPESYTDSIKKNLFLQIHMVIVACLKGNPVLDGCGFVLEGKLYRIPDR